VDFGARFSAFRGKAFPVVFALTIAACESPQGDTPVDRGAPPPNGTDLRIRDIADPRDPKHAAYVNTSQLVSGAVVVAVDRYDETKNGKGTGTVYVQDLAATKATPYAGISLFSPTFTPSNLAVAPGDVLDLRGVYQENTEVPVKFPLGAPLPQVAQPAASFRFETEPPAPIDIAVEDLADYAKGRQWLGMLVRITNIEISQNPFTAANGRYSIDLPPAPRGEKCESPFPKTATLVNDLFDLGALGLKKGDTLESVVGVVSYLCNLKIAPRSPADIQVRKAN